MSKHKELLYKKHDQFDAAEDKHKSLLKFEIKAIVEGLASPDAQDLHILGLVHYDTSKNIHEIIEAHKYFLDALEEDENYYMARLFSAHCFHDKNEYSEALAKYLKVDAVNLREEFPLWRFVKLQEQIGFCYSKLGQYDLSIKYFNDVLDFYRKVDFEELVDPVEIFECLEPSEPVYRELKEIEWTYYES